MQKYTFIVGGSYINLTNMETGNSQTVLNSDARFVKAAEMIKRGEFEQLEKMLDIKIVVSEMTQKSVAAGVGSFVVSLDDGQVNYSYKGGEKKALNNAIVSRIVKMAEDGFDVKPLCKFMANLLDNPSNTAIEELYLFLDACQLPITEDGYFIAYKIVRNDYKDIYTGKMDNKIGTVLEMPRFEVDTNRNNTCSRGLHFCSKGYLNSYGSDKRNTDRALLVKINPADVVSIPSDYNNAKGRAWRYEVVGEVSGNWRDTLPKQDYTSRSVVDSCGDEFDDEVVDTSPYFYNHVTRRWHDSRTNSMVSRTVVAAHMGESVEFVEDLE